MIIRLLATLDRIEKKEAVLKVEGDQEFRIPKEELVQTVIGDEYVIQVMPRAEAEQDQQELARTLLNQILRPDESRQPQQPRQ